MSRTQSAILAMAGELRSFPRAVSSLVRAMLDTDADEVDLIFSSLPSIDRSPVGILDVASQGRAMGRESVDAALAGVRSGQVRPDTRWILAAVHHADALVADLPDGSRIFRLPGLVRASSLPPWHPPNAMRWSQRFRLRALGRGASDTQATRTPETLVAGLPSLLPPGDLRRVFLLSDGAPRLSLAVAARH